MSNRKSPGPDRMSPIFYKSYWGIIGKKLIQVVQSFFSVGILPYALNHTFISLVPKSDKARKVDNFQPIALCNAAFKVISKLLARRLGPLLEKLISLTQSAFVPNRNITNNTIINHKIVHFMNTKKGRVGFMALKIDMAKAYNRVD